MTDQYGLDVITGGVSIRFPGWLAKSANWIYKKITGERLYEPELQPRGISMAVAFSFPGFWGGGEWDAGIIMTSHLGGVDIGLGKGSIDIGYHRGSLKDLPCENSVELGVHGYKLLHGTTFTIDEELNVTGIAYNFGPGFYLGFTV